MTLEEPEKTPEIPTESKYADDFKFWRIGTDFHHLLIQIQIAITNLQTLCLKYNWAYVKSAYNRLTLYPDLSPHLALQLYKAFIRSKLEFGCTVWGFRIHNAKHLKLLESAQRGAASLILKTMKSIPTDRLEQNYQYFLLIYT